MGSWPSIVEDCKRFGTELTPKQCTILFTNGEPESFGEMKRGELAADASIAGQGVLIALAVPTFLMVALGIVFAGVRGLSVAIRAFKGQLRDDTATDWASEFMPKLHHAIDPLVLSITDAQLWLLLAFGISFRLQSMCTLSVYHVQIAMHVGATGLSSAALALLIVPSFGGWRCSTPIRAAILAICIVGFLYTVTSFKDLRIGEVQGNLPHRDQDASLVLLRAFCLIEEGFDPVSKLEPDERKRLQNTGLPADLQSLVALSAFFVFIATAAAFFTLFFFTVRINGVRARHEPSLGSREGMTIGSLLLVKFSVWFASTGVIAWNAASILLLRKWVHDSGWMALQGGRNPEKDVQGIGQLAPLVALGAVTTVVLEQFGLPRRGPPKPPSYESIELGRL